MKKHPGMWTIAVATLTLNVWLLARLPEGSAGGGVYAFTDDERFTVWFNSLHVVNPLHPDHGAFGQLKVSSREDNVPDLFTMRCKPAAKSEMDFRRDATVKWLDGKHIIAATTPYLTLRLDLEALDTYRNSKDND